MRVGEKESRGAGDKETVRLPEWEAGNRDKQCRLGNRNKREMG